MKTFSPSILFGGLVFLAVNCPSWVEAKCFYGRASRNEGEKLRGDTFTCTCGRNGNWKNCVRNNDGDSFDYEPSSSDSIEGIVFNNGDFETLFTALNAADLLGILDGEGPYTVFAPTDEAFASLPKGVLNFLLDNPDTLSDVLKYHVVDNAKVLSKNLKNNQKVKTLYGENVVVKVGCIKKETVQVARRCGGWAPCFGSSKATQTKCVESGVAIETTADEEASTVTTADVEATNGIIHIIDKVLVPPSLKEAVAKIAQEEGQNTIEDIVLASDQFSNLALAIDITDLVGVLDGEGPFTVFAPTDRAFDKVPQVLTDFLLDNPDTLADVLKYHVVANAKVMAKDLEDGQEVGTFLGDEIVVEKTCFDDACSQFTVVVDDSYVVAADIMAFNGVVHVIDEVMIPPSLESAVNNILST